MANVNGTEINLMPTEGMRAEARRYRAWKEDGEAGGTEVAARRASQILSGNELSPDTVITMAAWFARHEVDKQGKGFSPGEDGYPSPGRVSWAAWGGDAGQTWSTAKSESIKKAREDRSIEGHEARPYPNEHAARLIDPDRFERFRRENGAGGAGIDFIFGIRTDEPTELQAIRFDASRFTVAQAREWLDEHDYQPILFEPAADSMDQNDGRSLMDLRNLNSRPLRRSVAVDYVSAVRAEDTTTEESRTLEFSFSSEQPVDRWFGPEVLSHSDGAMDMSRLNDGAPLLWNHDPDRVLGVIERAWLDNGRGMVAVRFSRSQMAEEKLADIRDGILRNVSVGYSIIDAEPIRQDGIDGILATSWQPHEVSVVSVPADSSVGIGRMLDDDAAAAQAAPLTPNDNNPMEPSVNLEEVRAQAAADERSRVASITSLCREHKADDLAQGLIESGASEADAMRSVLSEIAKRPAAQPATAAAPVRSAQPIANGGGSADIGLTDKEARSFSFVRAIRAQMMPGDRAAFEAAAFEREVSEATAQRMGVTPRGILAPNDVLHRDLVVDTASAAGDLVFTDGRPGSFIELLRNRLALNTLGVTMLTGLQGPVAIPRQTGAATAYWVAEGGDPTESQPSVDQVALVAKTLGAYTEFSRRLMLQSSIDVEQMVRTELATVIALEIDRAALYGLGSNSQPEGLKFVTGINTEDFNAANPTYAELVSMESKVAADNADIGAMSYLTNSTIYGGFKTTEKASSTAQFVLEPGGTVNGYNTVRSNQVATGDVFFGVWNQMIMGMWGALDIQVNPYALDKSGSVRVTALQDVDVAVRHPEAFCRGNNNL
ncbi:MAG: phage major capsid protein [Synechococcaceae bacterium WB9_4xC_028]|nr:phage major capsid protein [Synechococcaceae bacterium WB9_4xC_028]